MESKPPSLLKVITFLIYSASSLVYAEAGAQSGQVGGKSGSSGIFQSGGIQGPRGTASANAAFSNCPAGSNTPITIEAAIALEDAGQSQNYVDARLKMEEEKQKKLCEADTLCTLTCGAAYDETSGVSYDSTPGPMAVSAVFWVHQKKDCVCKRKNGK